MAKNNSLSKRDMKKACNDELKMQQDHASTKLVGAQYLKDASVSLTDARAIALKSCSGSIVSEDLEKEQGGSGLRYSLDIKSASVTHEIGIDAKDGNVLENSVAGVNAN